MQLVYVFDAYCGWSYGFAPTLAEVVRRNPDAEVQVVSGGLFTGPRRVPIREFGYVEGANAKITELTGARFGAGYGRLIADGSFVMDSEAAARGVVALRRTAPDRVVELTTALQQAFYVDGHSLSDARTYRLLAEQAGLDPDAVLSEFHSPASAETATNDFAQAARLGVRSYPTLLAVTDTGTTTLAVGAAGVDEIDRQLHELTAAR